MTICARVALFTTSRENEFLNNFKDSDYVKSTLTKETPQQCHTSNCNNANPHYKNC